VAQRVQALQIAARPIERIGQIGIGNAVDQGHLVEADPALVAIFENLDVVARDFDERRDDGHHPGVVQILGLAQQAFRAQEIEHHNFFQIRMVFQQDFEVEAINRRALDIEVLADLRRRVEEREGQRGLQAQGVDFVPSPVFHPALRQVVGVHIKSRLDRGDAREVDDLLGKRHMRAQTG